MKRIHILIFGVLFFCVLLGCATITPTYDPVTGKLTKLDSRKFGADLEYYEEWEYNDDGSVKIHKVSYKTKTNVDRILGGLADVGGTLIDGASKAMP